MAPQKWRRVVDRLSLGLFGIDDLIPMTILVVILALIALALRLRNARAREKQADMKNSAGDPSPA
jgi:hypothetical protein